MADCQKWGTTQFKWSQANWLWSLCGPGPIPPTPVVSIANPPGVDATTLIQPWIEEPWNPYRAGEIEREKKQKLLIELICKVHGEEFNEKKMRKKFKVTANAIKMLINEGAKIDLDLKME